MITCRTYRLPLNATATTGLLTGSKTMVVTAPLANSSGDHGADLRWAVRSGRHLAVPHRFRPCASRAGDRVPRLSHHRRPTCSRPRARRPAPTVGRAASATRARRGRRSPGPATKARRRSVRRPWGVCARVVADTVEYCKQRQQFGQPIGSFQVLQHRMVDMYMELEQAVAAVYLAVLNLDAEPDHSSAGSVGGQSDDRPCGAVHRPECRATSRRHGHDRRARRSVTTSNGSPPCSTSSVPPITTEADMPR